MNIEEEIQVIEKIGDALYSQGQESQKLTSESVTAMAQMIQTQGNIIKSLEQQINDQKQLIMQLGANQKQLLTEISVNRYQINAAQDNIYNLVAGTIGASEKAKREIFLNMPSATGKDRLWQLITLGTMRELNKECQKADAHAFLIFGTLLGALRHRGFIPWDDDIDTAITDDDFARLYDCIEHDSSCPVQLMISYAPKARAIQCRAVFRDSVIPGCQAFSDVFPFHYITGNTTDDFNRFGDIKVRLNQRLDEIRSRYADYLEDDPMPAVPVGAMILDRELETDGYSDVAIEAAQASRDALQALLDEGLMVPGSQTNGDPDHRAKAIKYSIYSYRSNGSPLLDIDRVFPLSELTFEGEKYPAPQDAEWVIRRTHGDYLTLPHDIHMNHEDLTQSTEELQQMLDKINSL